MKTINKTIEIARSFSRKVNLGNYETADFFASCKCECDEKEASKKSRELFNFCKSEVENSIKDLKLKNVEKNIQVEIKLIQDQLMIAKRNKKTQEISDLKFELGMYKNNLKWCKIV